MDIGFIGVGDMGSRIVTLMLEHGHHLTMWARRPQSLEPFAGKSDNAASPSDVGKASELVGICVWNEQDVEQVLLGDSGVLAGLRPGGVVAIHSTISPAACRRMSNEAAARGIGFVDAPVSVGLNMPKLLVMVGGEADVVQRCRDAFDAFGDPVLHLGPVGSGQVAKLVNNTLLAASIGLTEDAISLGADLGLDRPALVAALSAGSSRGTWTSFLAPRPPNGPAMSPRLAHEWALKDVGLTLELAAEAGLDRMREVLRLGARGIDVLKAI